MSRTLGTSQEMYDAGQMLMVPLHAAFTMHEKRWEQEFSGHFAREFARLEAESGNEKMEDRLGRLQYLYLSSRFLVLAAQSGKRELIPVYMPSVLYREVERLWKQAPAWQWGRKPFEGGMKERVVWKLSEPKTDKHYYTAIMDEELFLFAIAADLRTYERETFNGTIESPVITDVLATADKAFRQGVKFRGDGRWVFQPGIWSDHPDYLYAGRREKKASMKPAPVKDIAWDTSHSHRFPLWLLSMSQAQQKDSANRRFYEALRKGMEKQFYEQVLVQPSRDFPAYRTKNFIDGRNGVYRWGYKSLGADNGYGPYELSDTLLLGWWTFLDSERIRHVYSKMSQQFPGVANVAGIYNEPDTPRKQASTQQQVKLRSLLMDLSSGMEVKLKN
ncbi:hypothetical protein [Aneurinibacillus aneurinilyticus]|uniref:hypothetical protein n=1 Tax=Aneurinibacillus aneurinilyticus TaxID=1391 RepID=UPI00058AF47A|nr:hypothetical protein [Aneurinibacillus aneurinilyticus]MED0706412.1 hypothetical protein [Aneurinibacillus aneurinilyticus]MED0730632.1 hypothetical protein [Aneurinibacillus aneurinilyticus]MED0741038.1 hypothetical protein [Aneurinibacillus aneurinilyticus]